VDGTEGIGPTLKGILGRKEKMTDGSVITVDPAYLRESIVKPDAKIVQGFDDLMTKTELTDEEVEEIVEYLETLK
jgi:cytochrome c oxidase subunit 2